MQHIIHCPQPDCGVPARIVDRRVWASRDGPVEHVKTWCASGHWFTPALDTPTVQPTVTHAIVEPPGDQYGTWAKGTSAVPHALGQPNLLHTASPILGAFSVAVSSLLSLAVLAALVLLTREARANQLRPAGRER